MVFVVMQNDTQIQAVKLADNNVVQAVFYKGNSTLDQKGAKFSVSNPCIVQIELVGIEYVVSVQDPEMNAALKQITVTFNNKSFLFEMAKGK